MTVVPQRAGARPLVGIPAGPSPTSAPGRSARSRSTCEGVGMPVPKRIKADLGQGVRQGESQTVRLRRRARMELRLSSTCPTTCEGDAEHDRGFEARLPGPRTATVAFSVPAAEEDLRRLHVGPRVGALMSLTAAPPARLTGRRPAVGLSAAG